ncbi:MAG: helix-turn-helix transcriptional regulator [Blastomonas sp.]|jgi:AraC-like DNA-binding protein
MPETLFALDQRNYRDCQRLFRGNREQEYYRGDYWLDDAQSVSVTARKREAGPYAIIVTRAETGQNFRRNQRHIREDATDLSILWFVRRGSMRLCNQFGSLEVGPGDALVTRSTAPFLIELQPDGALTGGGVSEVLHVTVPTHLLRAQIPREIASSLLLPAERREIAIARNILTDVFDDDSGLAQDTARMLVEFALATVGHAVRASETLSPTRRTVAERRLDEVLRFIEVHLCDPALSTTMVSEGCGLSLRYLSLLLRSRGTTFSELVWSQRLERARDWLMRSDPREMPISEIAYGIGFKSPAHFSRMFKRVFGENPSDCRAIAPPLREAAVSGFCDLEMGTLQ